MSSTVTRRVAAITGGGTGVGAAVALRLAAASFDVAILFRSSKDAAESTAKQVLALSGARVLLQQVDVADDASVKARYRCRRRPLRSAGCAGQQRGCDTAHPVCRP